MEIKKDLKNIKKHLTSQTNYTTIELEQKNKRKKMKK